MKMSLKKVNTCITCKKVIWNRRAHSIYCKECSRKKTIKDINKRNKKMTKIRKKIRVNMKNMSLVKLNDYCKILNEGSKGIEKLKDILKESYFNAGVYSAYIKEYIEEFILADKFVLKESEKDEFMKEEILSEIIHIQAFCNWLEKNKKTVPVQLNEKNYIL